MDPLVFQPMLGLTRVLDPGFVTEGGAVLYAAKTKSPSLAQQHNIFSWASIRERATKNGERHGPDGRKKDSVLLPLPLISAPFLTPT
jgi:hypothetical protein